MGIQSYTKAMSVVKAETRYTPRLQNQKKVEEKISRVMKLKLTELDLACCGLCSLPPVLGKLTWIKKLNLAFNSLTELPSSTADLVNLEVLNLTGNKLKSLSSIPNLGSLKELILTGNQLQNLTSMPVLPKLKTLFLDTNELKDLPPMNNFVELETLLLDGNQFTRTPYSIKNLPKLKEVSMEENPFKDGDIPLRFQPIDDSDILMPTPQKPLRFPSGLRQY